MKHSILRRTTLAALLAATSAVASAHGVEVHLTRALNANKIVQTDAALRDLWVEHALWVRNVVLASEAGNGAAAAAAEAEAVSNARRIAHAMEGFYGKAAADQLFGLLAGHYGAVKQYATATLANDAARQQLARDAMIDNGGQLAQFLSTANPHLPLDAVRGMLMAHGGHHMIQIQQLHDKQYAQEARTWEDMKNHMVAIADALTVALSQQFPAKFETIVER